MPEAQTSQDTPVVEGEAPKADAPEKSPEEVMYGDTKKEEQVGDDNGNDGEDGSQKGDDPKKESGSDQEPPEKYELKLPEESLLDSESVSQVEQFAKQNKLTQEQAQKLLEQNNALLSNYQQNQVEGLKQKAEEWKSQSKSDKEIGGDGFSESVELAHRALDKFATKELKDVLDQTGFGNHPEIVRVFSRIGKQISDDEFVVSGQRATQEKSAVEVFYGDSKGENY